MTAAAAAPDRLVLLLAALAIDAYAGDWFLAGSLSWHPASAMAWLIGWLDRKLNRRQRGAAMLRARGVLTAVAVVSVSVAAGLTLSYAADHLPLLWLIELAAVTSLIDQRRLHGRVAALAEALEHGRPEDVATALRALSPRDPGQADRYEIARIGIEAVAVRFAAGVAGPVLAYGLLGLGGLLGYRAGIELAAALGGRAPDYVAFGAAARRLGPLFGWLPARLGALALALAALAPAGTSAKGAFATMIGDAGRHPDRNAGWPIAAIAGALGLALAGPRRYQSRLVATPWIGHGRARATAGDLRRARKLLVIACLVAAAPAALAALARMG